MRFYFTYDKVNNQTLSRPTRCRFSADEPGGFAAILLKQSSLRAPTRGAPAPHHETRRTPDGQRHPASPEGRRYAILVLGSLLAETSRFDTAGISIV